MTKAEALNKFIQKEIKEEEETLYKNVMDYLVQQQNKVYQEIIDSFFVLCMNYKKVKEEQEAPKQIAYIQYSLVRTKVLLHQEAYLVEAFDQNLYLGGWICQTSYHPKWLFDFLFDFEGKIRTASKKYFLKLGTLEVDQLFLIELNVIQHIIKQLLKISLFTLVQTKEWKELVQQSELILQVGDYRGEFDILYHHRG